jgi:hypothetical protein
LKDSLDGLLNDKETEFVPTGGDISSDEKNIGKDHEEIIRDDIKAFIDQQSDFTIEDVIEIIQLFDTDGVYCPDEAIMQKRPDYKPLSVEEKKPTYHADKIEVCDIQAFKKTRDVKRDVIRYLRGKEYIEFFKPYQKIPYSCYYMSCNLDHALYDEQNLPDLEKRPRANDFTEAYYGKNVDFVKLIDSLNSSGTYNLETSWSYIQTEFHSLGRGSNFIIFLRKINPSLVIPLCGKR